MSLVIQVIVDNGTVAHVPRAVRCGSQGVVTAVGECCDKNHAKRSACVAGLVTECCPVGVDVKVAELAVAKTSSNCVQAWTQELSHIET